MSVLTVDEDRYDRQRRITWWDQEVLAGSSVLVVGAGALGNEILKNLVLVGVGSITVIDFDHIEPSNLARCVLFRQEDAGRSKAETAAAAAAELNPDVTVTSWHGNVAAVGLGAVGQFDLVIGGLDSREARAWVNQAARKVAVAWVDGAIEGLRGVVRAFLPDGPCYECTLGAVDRELLEHRRSCTLLSAEEMQTGRAPTTATTASIIAAMQVQEAIKLLHGRSDLLALAGKGLVYVGETLDNYLVEYSEDPECLAHDTYGQLREPPARPRLTAADLFEDAAGLITSPVALEFESELIRRAGCEACGIAKDVRTLSASMSASDATCPACDAPMRLDASRALGVGDALADTPLADLSVPDLDVVTVRSETQRVHYLVRRP